MISTYKVVPLEKLANSERSAIKIGPFGSQLKKEDLTTSGIHVVGIENILNDQFDGLGNRYISQEKFSTLKSFEIRPGDILITMMGTIGEVGIVPDGIKTSIMDSHLLRFRPNTKICTPEYVKWLIKESAATKQVLHGKAHGAIMKGLNSSIVKKLPAPLPIVSEQKHIVSILNKIDSIRIKRDEYNVKFDELLSAIFYKFFGDPATNPMAWTYKPLGEVCIQKPQYGANASSKNFSKGEPRYVRITDINEQGRLRQDEKRGIDLADWDEYKLIDGDLLFARSGATVGKTYLYRNVDGLCVYAGYLIRFRTDPNKILPRFLFALTRTPYYKAWVTSKKRVAAQPNINGQEYSSFRIPVPPIDLQKKFTVIYKVLENIEICKETKDEKIKDLFLNVVYKAFSGELTSKWRTEHAKELLAETREQEMLLNCGKD
ncbi:MAG TPA: restriction endonuclease subunit S [Candidatus Omnitrophota bacterium]|nr:restriction endonuclease subunit S [Candidatus Omnitrophota bacterium]